jgi:preprotein translocase subunit YajC
VGGLLIIIVLFGAVWLIFLMPARRRRFAHAAMQDSIDPGNEIITAGGLHGVVKEIADDVARVEIAPGVVVTLDRRAIAAVATEVEVEVERDPEPEHEPEIPVEPS